MLVLIMCRTDIPGLVENLIGVCFHWNRYYTIVRPLSLSPYLLHPLTSACTNRFRLNVSSSSSSGHTDRYARLRSMGKPLGATFLGISIVMLFIGFHRYFESQHWIIRGKFPASRGSIIIVALVTFALMVTSLVVVVVVEPGVREK